MSKEKTRILLTGASGRLGKFLSELLSKNKDCELVKLFSEKNPKKDSSSNTKIERMDLRKTLDIENLVRKIVQKYGNIDILINNAAVLPINKIPNFIEYTPDTLIQDTFNVNAVAVLLLMKHFLLLKKRPGVIINILTQNAVTGGKHIQYLGAKGAMLNASRTLAAQNKDVRFICFMPGQFEDKNRAGLPLKRIGKALQKRLSNKSLKNNFEIISFLNPINYIKYHLKYILRLIIDTKYY